MLEMAVTTAVREKFSFQAAPDMLAALRQMQKAKAASSRQRSMMPCTGRSTTSISRTRTPKPGWSTPSRRT